MLCLTQTDTRVCLRSGLLPFPPMPAVPALSGGRPPSMSALQLCTTPHNISRNVFYLWTMFETWHSPIRTHPTFPSHRDQWRFSLLFGKFLALMYSSGFWNSTSFVIHSWGVQAVFCKFHSTQEPFFFYFFQRNFGFEYLFQSAERFVKSDSHHVIHFS